jgi:SPP1 family predicted phage head-tail adaptor
MPFDPLFLPAGSLRHIVTVQSPSSTRDSAGQPISTWTTILTTRAQIESTTGSAYKELVQDGAIAAQSTDVFTLRWPGSSVDLQPGMRVLFQDNTYIVQAVDNALRRNRVVKLFTMAIDSDDN